VAGGGVIDVEDAAAVAEGSSNSGEQKVPGEEGFGEEVQDVEALLPVGFDLYGVAGGDGGQAAAMAERRAKVSHERKTEATGRGMSTTRRERRTRRSLSVPWSGSGSSGTAREERPRSPGRYRRRRKTTGVVF
jgi:hypothetical protein